MVRRRSTPITVRDRERCCPATSDTERNTSEYAPELPIGVIAQDAYDHAEPRGSVNSLMLGGSACVAFGLAACLRRRFHPSSTRRR